VTGISAANLQAPSFVPITATGGTMSNVTVGSTTYRVHQFTTTGAGNFSVTDPGTTGEIEYLIVAGGGGGGMDMGGGGGGGGVISGKITVQAASYPIVVGAGGWGAPAGGGGFRGDGAGPQPNVHQFTIPATNGGNSSAFGFTAIGGGAGGSSVYTFTPGATGNLGGSGGGTSGYSNDSTIRAGGGYYRGQGSRGGRGGGQYYSGGGGGAGGAGTDSTAQANGGPGILSTILGNTLYWGGGGGGSGYTINGGNGGIGGGGGAAIGTTTGGVGLNNGQAGGGGSTGTQANRAGGNGGTNTGGGGGGGSHYNLTNQGGNGGSGIVIVRYPLTNTTITVQSPTRVTSLGAPIQMLYYRTDERSQWSAPVATLTGNRILPLGLTITPRRANSLIVMYWMINGEVHYNTNWIIYLGELPVTTAGYQGYNNSPANPGRWVGYVSGIYDAAGDVNSTMENTFIQYSIIPNSTQTLTFYPAIKSSSGTAYTFNLNRCNGSVGQDGFENGVSTGVIQEIVR
jgi:hypothetical protein